MDQLTIQRQQKDQFFKTHPQSPLLPEQQEKFERLNYYDPDPAYVIEAVPEIFLPKLDVKMQTSTGEIRHYRRWGRVKFQVAGQDEAVLTLYQSPGDSGFFVPFMDATSGTETYSAGRYVEAESLPNGNIHLDFNDAYNPYCAYNARWSCPIPPAENRLKVAIRAGEKTPSRDWAAHS